jgi:hypothetical protein
LVGGIENIRRVTAFEQIPEIRPEKTPAEFFSLKKAASSFIKKSL